LVRGITECNVVQEILGSECQTSGTYAKRAKQATKKRRDLVVFSELPSLPSAGSRPGCFHTSLGCEPRSLIRVSLGCSIIQKNVRKDNPTPAYSPVSDRSRLTALVEVNWARRVQAPMPQISGPNFQENHIIETCKEKDNCLCFLNYLAFLWPAADRAVSILPWVVSRGRSYGFLWAVRLFKKM
jgi:hypothetical protein